MAKIVAKAVAVNNASLSIPVVDNILGFTIRIYDIVRKVIRPARNSLRMVVLFSESLNVFSSKFFIFY